MKTMRILVGLPASGKSTYARSCTDSSSGKWASINWDNLRHYDSSGQPREYRFSRLAEAGIKMKSVDIAKDYLDHGFNLIVDNTNLTESARLFWKDKAYEWGMLVEVVEFNTPLDECLRRNALRTNWQRVPRPVIERMALFSGRVTWPVGEAVLVDIDGTLADGTHRQQYVSTVCRHCQGCAKYEALGGEPRVCLFCLGTGTQKKDWKSYHDKAHLDLPVKAVIEWTRMLYDHDYYVCIVSGRGLEGADTTVDWLTKHNVQYHRIFMRNAGDNREDSIIKKEILDKITPNIDVAFAVDDRPRVIRMWRENGVTVYDVGKGIEF
jgi:predicted kinase